MRNSIIHGILLLLFMGTVACTKNAKQNDQIKEEVTEWIGRKIQFPADMIFMRYALDTVSFDFQSREYKIVIYTDSSGCTTCKLKLSEWIKMMSLTDSVAPGKVNYLFFFDGGKINDVRHMLKQTGLQLPVCIDSKSQLNQLNQFSENTLFHTFLLNKDNQVMAVGNPIQSPEMRDLYIQQITGTQPAAKSSIQTTATLNPNEINFGKFTMEQKQKTQFTITNQGNQPLVLIEAISSCGCTDVIFSKKPISPGKTTSVEVCFTPQETGTFSKTVTLYANTKQPLTFTLRGEVIAK